MILVVGATGQLGTAIVHKLIRSNKPVRALVRPTSDYRLLKDLGAELAFGDLRDPASLGTACRHVEAVIATANAVIPRKGDSFDSIEGEGYRSLIQACTNNKVGQFIFASVPISSAGDQVPTPRYKRLTEKRLQESGLDRRAAGAMQVLLFHAIQANEARRESAKQVTRDPGSGGMRREDVEPLTRLAGIRQHHQQWRVGGRHRLSGGESG